jgi:hypothetical protein
MVEEKRTNKELETTMLGCCIARDLDVERVIVWPSGRDGWDATIPLHRRLWCSTGLDLSVSSLICRKTLIWIGLANSAVERLANVLSCVHQVASSALLPRRLFTSKPTFPCAAISDAMGQSRHFASQINSEVVTQGVKLPRRLSNPRGS